MSNAVRAPVSTAHWIGDTVYRKYARRSNGPGIIRGVYLLGDPAFPTVKYWVIWPKTYEETDDYEIELTKEKPEKKYVSK